MFIIDFEQVNALGKHSMSLNTAFKCPKSTTKTLGKSVKYVQGGIIHRKMSGGNSIGGNFQRGKLLSREELFKKVQG